MATTALIVEMIIIGVQTVTWLILLVFLTTDYHVMRLDALSNWNTLLLFLSIGVCYTLGVVFDAVAAWIEERGPFRRQKDQSVRDKERHLRQLIRFHNLELAKEMDGDEYRLRLMRSTALNLVLIFIVGSLLIATSDPILWRKSLFIFILSMITVFGIYAWYRRLDRFRNGRDLMHQIAEWELSPADQTTYSSSS